MAETGLYAYMLLKLTELVDPSGQESCLINQCYGTIYTNICIQLSLISPFKFLNIFSNLLMPEIITGSWGGGWMILSGAIIIGQNLGIERWDEDAQI